MHLSATGIWTAATAAAATEALAAATPKLLAVAVWTMTCILAADGPVVATRLMTVIMLSKWNVHAPAVASVHVRSLGRPGKVRQIK